MNIRHLEYESPMYAGRAKQQQKTKREQAADLINAGRKLAREALDEENRDTALIAEYGPRIKDDK